MTFRTDDLQSARFPGRVVQLDIRTTAGHIGRDGHSAVDTGLSDDLGLQLMEFRIQHVVLDSFFLQHTA